MEDAHMITNPLTAASNESSGHPAQSRLTLRELTYRYQVKRDTDGRPVTLGQPVMRASDAWAVVRSFLEAEAVEVLGVLCLTTKHRVICWHELSRGCLDTTTGHPRELFKVA